MKHYINDGGKVFAFESDGSQDHLITDDMTPITDAERDEMLAPTQSELDAKRVNEIDARLRAIDAESVRPLRAINNGTDTQTDRDRLAELDGEAETLRVDRATLV